MRDMSQLKGKLSRGFQAYYFFISIGFRKEFRFKSLLTIALGGAGISLQVGAISLALKYLSHSVKHETFDLLGQTYELRTSVLLLGLTTLFCFLLLVLSSIATFYSHKLTMQLGASAEHDIFGRIYEKLVRSPLLKIPEHDQKTDTSFLVRTLVSDARTFGRAFHISLMMVVPAFTFVGAIISLLLLHPLTTLTLIPFATAMLFFVYRENQASVTTSKKFEKIQSQYTKYAADKIAALAKSLRSDLNVNLHSENDDFHPKIPTQSFADLMLIPYRSSLISDLFLAGTASFVLFTLSASAISGRTSWTSIAAYLVSIRYGTNALKTLLSRFSVLGRFLPQMTRIRSLLQSIDKKHLVPPQDIRLTHPSFPGKYIPFETGSPIGIVSPQYINRFNISRLFQSLHVEGTNESLARFYRPRFHFEIENLLDENSVFYCTGLEFYRERHEITQNSKAMCRLTSAEAVVDPVKYVIVYLNAQVVWLGNSTDFYLIKDTLNLNAIKAEEDVQIDHDQDIDDTDDFE